MKVLVVSHNSFSKTQNNGKTLCSFFSKFASENIAQLYAGVNEVPNEEVCLHYYRVSELDVLKSILNLSFTTSNSHSTLMAAVKGGRSKERKWFNILKKYQKKIILYRELMWSLGTWNSKELNKWIAEFQPDVVFALLGNGIYLHRIATSIAEKYKLPLFIYFTDDYTINSTAKGLLERIHYKMLCKQYRKTISIATKAYAIGEKMKDDYSAVYSKEFGVLGNCIDVASYSHIEPIYLEQNKPIYVTYMGALHSNRWQSISELGNIVKSINEERGYNIIVKVFSQSTLEDKIKKSFDSAGVVFCGALDAVGVMTQMEKSHFLLHVESFDKTDRTYVKYSVSTKISEYLISNRIIMAYGPHEVASIQLLNDYNFGCILTDLDTKEDMKEKICQAIETYDKYDYRLAKQYVEANYNKEVISELLLNDFLNATKKDS